jgi:hypothetical protein
MHAGHGVGGGHQRSKFRLSRQSLGAKVYRTLRRTEDRFAPILNSEMKLSEEPFGVDFCT